MCPQTMAQILPRRVFVTVGSTRFDALVHAVLSPQVIEVLTKKLFGELVIQCGESDLSGLEGSGMMAGLEDEEMRTGELHGIKYVLYKFKPSLEEEYDRASLIIGHGGSGTILSALSRRKPLLVVPNPTLAENHQQEVADMIAKNKQNVAVCQVKDLSKVLQHLQDPREALQRQQMLQQQQRQQQQQQGSQSTGPPGQRFASIMDETMGFTPR